MNLSFRAARSPSSARKFCGSTDRQLAYENSSTGSTGHGLSWFEIRSAAKEKRRPTKSLPAVTKWKHPAAMDVDTIIANFRHNVRNDGGRAETIVVRGPGDVNAQ
jgi:hypothetical protein